ncbi:uncharacterized protein LOC133198457 [Saccostrea echinata]|uniref:uncharacterized protein LOC133198457 n=1 Tax=Saccostrea echinata TaxID=191078 RepID=UPI002A8218F2|nr:uncharacterized protein LOC133198457 [Saccostrea echinata]
MAERLKELIDYGVSLGYKEDDLREFVRTQQEIEREDRRAERERQKAELEYQQQKEKYDKEMKLQQITHQCEMEILQAKGKLKIGASDEVSVKIKGPKIPAFEDGKDDMDSYLRRFERYAESQKWPKLTWATNLSALLKGKALDVYALLPSEEALDYDKLKLALLKRYDLTEDRFKRKFRSSRPEEGANSKVYSRYGSFSNQYREARLANTLTFTSDKSSEFRPQKKDRHDNDSHRNNKGERKYQAKSSFIPKSERRCYVCHKIGHIASECRNKSKVSSVTHQQSENYVNEETGKDEPVAKKQNNMPVSAGYAEGKPVTVLRDTGCSGIVVRKSKVGEDKFIEHKFQTCILADGSSVKVPVATISIDTPYITGTFEAWCMDNPIYDLIIGNVDKVRSPDDPDPLWTEAHAVETRQQVKNKQKPYPQLKVPEIVKDNIRPNDIRTEQENDETLGKIRQWAAADQELLKRRGKIRWFLKNGLIYRKYQSTDENGKIFIQLVVPQKFIDVVMKLAHESIMSGHLATCRTTSRILTEFYWPGIQSDVKRFCRSCDICQRTVHKGRVTKYPLQKMPLIDEVFKRVAVDIVGPIHPVTDKGNRYILTLVDFASRYPEAIPLASIETERVAEGLLDIFSRMGIPDEILSDMGSQFTSALMREVSRLLSVRQITTTPYHPMTNGMVERFNGTLKQMLKRVCADRPRDWDRYINPVLFAYREVPQESLGFSPFEIVFGRYVKGPMSILKELWTRDIDDPQVRTTYQYVLDLRERLESTAELARENLEKASRKQTKYYNKSARARNLKVNDKVLVLLPTDSNKLLLQWKGPFNIKKKVNKVDYQISMGGKLKTFHINMLKKHLDRNTVREDSNHEVNAVVSSAVTDCTADEQEETDDIPSAGNTEGPESVDINPELSDDDRRRVISLLNQFSDVLSDIPGYTHLIERDIKTNSDQPIRSKSYSVPFAMKDIVDKEVEKMLELNVIEPSESPYCSPIVLVKKKDNTFRFCVDFRAVNSCSQFHAEPMPNAEEIFSKFANHKVFSRLDLSKGYWQPLTASSKPKTAFQTPKGLFQFRVMPFGLVTAPATFSRLMRKLLYGMQNIDNFIDDVIIFTLDLDQHLKILEELFNKLRDANLTAKPSKCSIGYSSLECLGHIVGEDRLKPHPEKTDASDGGIGAVLLQLDNEIGLKLPVAYASRKLKPSECPERGNAYMSYQEPTEVEFQ